MMLFMTALFVISRIGGEQLFAFRIIMVVLPYVLLFIEGKYKSFLLNLILLFVFSFLAYVPALTDNRMLGNICMMFGGVFIRILPAIVTAKYVIATTKVSEFVAGMEKWHISEKLIIPASTMFRFMPTVSDEFRAIGDAMDMRQIRLGGNKATKIFEYRLVPMLICCVRIGEDLSAAAITRGLGSGVKRTNICKIGFHLFDYILLIFYAAIIVLLILSLLGVMP
ncbi:MAG: energy-coupling factor transporter transmembrane protein EcfT [Parasporobacterium sp.]|nr:energy-coupling factor transporter transmembrane protein EcfT [Parasporobacterium sp.]